MSPPTTLFTAPKRFFEDRGFSLTVPAGIVGTIILIRLVTGVIESLLLVPRLTQAMPGPGPAGDAAALSVIGSLIGNVASAVLGPLIAWVLFAGIFYALSELLGENTTGEFTDVLAVTAYGFVPRVITVAVGLVLAIVGVILLGPLSMAPSLTSTVLVLGPVVGLVMTLLSAYIWGNGLAVARNISPKQGYICTLPVVLLGLTVTGIGIVIELLGATML